MYSTVLITLSSFFVVSLADGTGYEKPQPEPNADVLKPGEAEEKIKEMAEFHNKRQCSRGKGFVEIPRSRASVRFSRVKDMETIVKKLIAEYCSLAPVMKEHMMKPPLYVEIGLSHDDLLVEALKTGCRSKVYRPSTKYYEQARASIVQHDLPEGMVELSKKAISDKNGMAKYRVGGGADDGLLGARSDRYIAGRWKLSEKKFEAREVETATLEKELVGEDVIPIVVVDGKGWDTNIINGAMSLFDTHKIQSIIFRLWPAGVRDANDNSLPKQTISDILYRLHRRGYYIYQTKPSSMNIHDVPHGPTCADHLIDYLDHTDTIDAYGASTYLVIVK